MYASSILQLKDSQLHMVACEQSLRVGKTMGRVWSVKSLSKSKLLNYFIY